MFRRWVRALVIFGLVAGCGGTPEESDGIDDVAIPTGKADSPYSACQLAHVVAYANDPAVSYETLRSVDVPTRSARNLIDHRDGPDGLPSTADDDLFDDPQELDAVPWVGPISFSRLVAAIVPRCEQVPELEAIFSPQPFETSHLARVIEVIDGAQRSLDLALYSFRDSHVIDALERAAAKGVSVRLLFEGASEDRKDPPGTASAKFEEMGVDVRWINKIMHHKFAIADGPRDAVAQAFDATLVTGSGNWSSSAGTRFDENTVVIRHHAEAVLRFQREFNHLWDNSRDFSWNQELQSFSSLPILEAYIPDDSYLDAVFTSANFNVKTTSYGPTFSVESGLNTAADRLVSLIQSAEQSIHVASGHLRSRPVAEALMARWAQRPDLDIRVYLDDQEYVSAGYSAYLEQQLQECLDAAGDSASARQQCLDRSFYYSYPLTVVGIPVRFKYYAYRWDYTYAPQMHHKYIIVDGRILASGSYNLSDNAEHNTMENVVVYTGPAFQGLVDAFEANFESIWETGRAGDGYASLMDEIANGSSGIPLVFDPIALDHGEVTALKALIREVCPAVDSLPYRRDPAAHRYCPR